MKKLILAIFLLSCFAGEAQTTYTSLFDTVVVNSNYTLIVKRPRVQATGIKYPVAWFFGGNGEKDNVSTATAVGPFRLMTGGAGTAQQNAMSVLDSAWIVQIIPFTNGCGCNPVQVAGFPNNIYTVMDKFDLTYGFTHQDTTRYMMSGISQGATNTIDFPTWPVSLYSFGNPTNYRANRFKMFVEASMCNPRSGSQPSLLAGKIVRLFHAAVDGTCGETNSATEFSDLAGAGVTNLKYTKFTGTFGHDNNTWDSAFSARGVDSAHNIWLLFLNKAGVSAPVMGQARVYDIFDAMYGSYDVNNPTSFFDNQKGGHSNVDPRNGVTTDTTSVSNPAHGFLNTNGAPRNDLDVYGFSQTNRGYPYRFLPGFSRAMVKLDLTGLRNLNDTTLRFVLQEVWWKDPGDTASVKIRLYNYDQQVMRKPVTSRWLYDSRMDSLCTQLDSLTSTASGAWEHVVIDSTNQRNRMRYLELMLTSTATHHVSKTNEIVLYGYYTADTSLAMYSDSVRKDYTGPIRNRRDSTGIYRKKIYTNVAQPVGLASLAHDGGQRIFTATNYYDNVNAPGIPTTINYWPGGAGDFSPTIIARNIAGGKDMILSTKGGNTYTGGLVNTDAPGLEAENPYSWGRDSALFSDLTKVYGRNSAGTNRFAGTVANGRNYFPYLETDNEPFFNGYTHKSNFWKARADYRAIKQVDPTMQIIQPGMVYAGDIYQVKSFFFYTQTMTTDKIFPHNILNGHYYLADQDSLGGIIHTLTEQQNSGSVPPAWAVNSRNNWLTFADSVKRQIYKYLPDTTQFWLTETGRDGYGTKPTTDLQAAATSQYTTASISGLGDSLQVKGIWDAQQNIFGWAAPFEKQVNFELTSVNNSPSGQFKDQFYSSGKAADKSSSDPFDVQTFFPAWYVTGGVFDNLQNYYCDSVMVRGGRTGVWVFRGHHYQHSDSVVYVVFYSAKTNLSSTYSLSVPGVSSVREFIPSFSTLTGTSTTLTPSAGAVSRTVTQMPRLYFGLESAGSPPSCTTNILPASGSTVASQTNAALSWSAAAGATSYQVWIDGVLVTSVGSTNYNAFGFGAGTTHSWYVVPTNGSGAASGCSAGAFIFTTAPLVTVQILKIYR